MHRWGAGTQMGPRARRVRGMKGSQMRWVAGQTSEQANGSGWLGKQVNRRTGVGGWADKWVTGDGRVGKQEGEVGELEGAVG